MILKNYCCWPTMQRMQRRQHLQNWRDSNNVKLLSRKWEQSILMKKKI